MSRCMYHSSLKRFIRQEPDSILGAIVSSFHGEVQTTSLDAWKGEITILQDSLKEWECEDAHVLFEYDIPRLGKRIDVVLLLFGIVFCLEFKVGQKEALQSDVEQVLDYAMDLQNFHLFSSGKRIAPILVPTRYSKTLGLPQCSAYDDSVLNPIITGAKTLTSVISKIVDKYKSPIDPKEWGTNWLISPYSPTPTIIEAARSLYENHSVEDITRHEADKVSTDATIAFIQQVIEKAKAKMHLFRHRSARSRENTRRT